jgi:type II secretion system protein L
LQAHTLLIFANDHASQDANAPFAWLALSASGAVVNGAAMNSIRPQRTVLVLPESRVLAVRIKVPDVGAAKIRELAPYAVEDRLASEPDQQVVAVSARERTGALAGTVLAWCVERRWLSQTIASVEAMLAQRLDQVVPESALLSTPVARNTNTWQMLLQLKESHAHAVLVSPDGQSSVSEVPVGDTRPPIAFQLALNRAGDDRPQNIVVRSMGVGIDAVPAWAHTLAAKVTQAPLFDSQTIAALQASPNLHTPTSERAQWLSALMPVAKLAAAVGVVHVLATVAYAVWLWWDVKQQQSKVQQQFTALFPNAQLVDAQLQTERNMRELRRAAGLASSHDLAAALATLDRVGLPASAVSSLSYNNPAQGNASLAVSVNADAKQIARWTQELASNQSEAARITVASAVSNSVNNSKAAP